MPDNPTYTDFETHFEKPNIQGWVFASTWELTECFGMS
jgi:hypothetical protein